jgi:ABC-type amino acid transport system permease subunit
MVGGGHPHLSTESVTSVHWVAVALAVLTGVIHVYVGAVRGRPSLLLAGLGFFGGIGLFLNGYRRRPLYVVGIVYVLIQIVIWTIVNAGEYTTIGIVDKGVQLMLVGLLAYLSVTNDRSGPET